jgi:hypothetical protein
MATCRQVVTAALRKLGLLDPEESLENAEAVTGLGVLQGFYQHLLNGGAFGRISDVLITADYTAKENERIAYSGETSATITLPTVIRDAVTGQDRAPLDHAVVIVVGSDPAQNFVYDGSFGDWCAIENLTLDTYAPFTNRLQIAAPLAVYCAPEYGREASPGVQREAAGVMLALLQRFPSPRRETDAAYY